MRKKFSILDLIDIFIEKILVLFGLIILSLLFSWYYLSIQIPKYSLHHKTFHIEYFEEKNLMDLSQLKFYTEGIHLQQLKSHDLEIINLEKNISYINYYLSKQEGV
ncbi:hypothetical protein OAZ15_04930, partial [Pelagibacteraceae bacterium]|nr:hypothetical protein [Pelagibacteraceae bacterium]